MPARTRLLLATAALWVLQPVHGAVPGPAGQVEGAFGKVIGTTGTILALVTFLAILRQWPAARRLALIAGAGIPLAFVGYHALPIETAITQPYWGDGSASLAQWLTVIAVIAAGIWTVVEARMQDGDQVGSVRATTSA